MGAQVETSAAVKDVVEATGIPEFWAALLIKLIAAGIVVLIGYIVYRLIMWPVKKHLTGSEQSKRGGSIFKNIVRVSIAIFVVCELLDILFGFDMMGVLGALGIVGVAVSLGAQQTIANIIGGIIISLTTSIGPGDWIVIGGNKEAEIIDTNWRSTKLIDEDGVTYIVPNSKMVSEIVSKKNPFYTIVVPFTLGSDTPNVEGLLADCEKVLLERQKECGIDYEEKPPKAHIAGSSLGVIQAEVKLYVDRSIDTRAAERAVLPALIDLLQQRSALTEIEALRVER